MSQVATNSNIARSMERIASLMASAERKRIRNDQASDREHRRLMSKVEHELDDASGSGCIRRRGLARIKNNSLAVPAERKRQLILSTSGRSFHGRGTTHSKAIDAQKGRGKGKGKEGKRAASSGAAHYRYIEDEERDEVLASLANGSHVSYIDGSRVERTVDGDRLSDSNIEGDFVERMRFFALAEQFERNSHGDHFSLNLNHANSESAAAFADPACDPAVKAAIHDHPLPHQGGPIKIKLEGTNRDLRNLIKSHGLEPSEAKFNDDRLKDDGFAFHSGRAGRTHFRWVFELPEEFTAEQRAEVLAGVRQWMGNLNCMWAAVVHAPDPHNDERNHHLHLIFYDRVCRRMKATDADLVNVSDTFRKDIRDEIAAGHIKEGEWDFTVLRYYKSVRSWKTHYPFRAEKSREVTKGKDWKKRFRQEYAAIVNGVAVNSRQPKIYDPRSYEDRNVDISPSKHLGELHQAEIAGMPTLIGLGNEGSQAKDERRSMLNRHATEAERLKSLKLDLYPFRPGKVSPMVARWAAHPLQKLADAKLANDAQLATDLWLLETERERSRPELVRNRQRRAAGKGSERERRERHALADAAEAHLRRLDAQDVDDRQLVTGVQDDIRQAEEVTDESIRMNAKNCAVLSRLHPLVVSSVGFADGVTASTNPVGHGVQKLSGSAQSEGTTVFGQPLDASLTGPFAEDDDSARQARTTDAETMNGSELITPSHTAVPSVHCQPLGDRGEAASQIMAQAIETSQQDEEEPQNEDVRPKPVVLVQPIEVGADKGKATTRPQLVMPPLFPTQETLPQVAAISNSLPLQGDAENLEGRTRPLLVVLPLLPIEVPRAPAAPILESAPPRPDSDFTKGTTRPSESRLPAQQHDAEPADDRADEPVRLSWVLARILAEGAHHDHQRDALNPIGVGPSTMSAKTALATDAVQNDAVGEEGKLTSVAVAVAAAGPRAGAITGHEKHDHHVSAWIAENMKLSWINRIEKRHVRLDEIDGVIVAAQPLDLHRGDADAIAGWQVEFRAVKDRQDRLAIEVAAHLVQHLHRLAAGEIHDAKDTLAIDLKEKWAADPAIASAISRVWTPTEEGSPPLEHASAHQAAILAGQGEGVT